MRKGDSVPKALSVQHEGLFKIAIPVGEILGPAGTTGVYIARTCSRCSAERHLKVGEDFFSRFCPDCNHEIGGGDGGYYYAYKIHVDANGKLPEHLEPLRKQIEAGQPVPIVHTLDAEHQIIMGDEWLWLFDWPTKSYGPQSPLLDN